VHFSYLGATAQLGWCGALGNSTRSLYWFVLSKSNLTRAEAQGIRRAAIEVGVCPGRAPLLLTGVWLQMSRRRGARTESEHGVHRTSDRVQLCIRALAQFTILAVCAVALEEGEGYGSWRGRCRWDNAG
jgi:hypothetical protein